MGKTKNNKRTISRRDFEKKTAHGNKSRSKIIDVPFSKKKSLGTRATKGKIDFHYQKYANMDQFFQTVDCKNLSKDLFYIDLICLDNKITPIHQKNIKVGKKSFMVFVINVTTSEGNHANIALVNNRYKRIEYFEPHGHRKNINSKISVKFKGLVSRDKAIEHMIEADVFISPSKGEGLPISVLEAMYSGCFTILSDIPPHREISPPRGTSISVDFNKKKEIVSALKLIDKSSLNFNNQGNSAKKYVLKNYNLSLMLNSYIDIYKDLLNIKSIFST